MKASNSDVLAMSAKLTQTREETRILKRDSGFTRSTLIEQETDADSKRRSKAPDKHPKTGCIRPEYGGPCYEGTAETVPHGEDPPGLLKQEK